MLVYAPFFFVGVSTCAELSTVMDSAVIYLLTKENIFFSSFL